MGQILDEEKREIEATEDPGMDAIGGRFSGVSGSVVRARKRSTLISCSLAFCLCNAHCVVVQRLSGKVTVVAGAAPGSLLNHLLQATASTFLTSIVSFPPVALQIAMAVPPQQVAQYSCPLRFRSSPAHTTTILLTHISLAKSRACISSSPPTGLSPLRRPRPASISAPTRTPWRIRT